MIDANIKENYLMKNSKEDDSLKLQGCPIFQVV